MRKGRGWERGGDAKGEEMGKGGRGGDGGWWLKQKVCGLLKQRFY